MHSVRPVEATTLQALELVNGEILTKWLSRGAKRLVGELPLEPRSLFNASVAGRYAAARTFDVDVASASKLWLVVTDTGSNAPERIEPMWVQAEFVQADGTAVPLSILTPSDASGLRGAIEAGGPRVAVKNSSRIVYDIAGKGFTRFRGSVDVANPRSEIGSTLNPQLRFFVFDREPNPDRLVPPALETPLPAPPVLTRVPDSRRSRVLVRAEPRALERGAEGRGSRAARSRAPGPAVGRGARGPALGGADEAGVPVDLLMCRQPHPSAEGGSHETPSCGSGFRTEGCVRAPNDQSTQRIF